MAERTDGISTTNDHQCNTAADQQERRSAAVVCVRPSPVRSGCRRASVSNACPHLIGNGVQGHSKASGEPGAVHWRRDPHVGASPGTREPALGWQRMPGAQNGLGVTFSATPSPGLDSASAPPPRCNGRGHDRGLRDRRGAGCDRPGHDCGFRHRRPDDTNSSPACWSEGHFSLLQSQTPHRPRSRR